MGKNYTIKDIESLTQYEVLKMDHEAIEVNGHQVYLVDFKGYFGYSALVFRAGAHLYYANDYELHHTGKTHEELKAWYEDTLKYKLFSDDIGSGLGLSGSRTQGILLKKLLSTDVR